MTTVRSHTWVRASELATFLILHRLDITLLHPALQSRAGTPGSQASWPSQFLPTQGSGQQCERERKEQGGGNVLPALRWSCISPAVGDVRRAPDLNSFPSARGVLVPVRASHPPWVERQPGHHLYHKSTKQTSHPGRRSFQNHRHTHTGTCPLHVPVVLSASTRALLRNR